VAERGSARVLATRVAIGASAATAVSLGFLALANALSSGTAATPAKDVAVKEIMAGQGINVSVHVPAQAASGFDWAATLTPAIIAIVLIALIVVLSSTLRSTRVHHA
jgi:hypothetical protein